MLYSDMTEKNSIKLLRNVSDLTGVKGITFSAMRKTLYAYSCICEKVIKIVECPKCHYWFITNNVLCPQCSKGLTRKDDYSQMLLYNCQSDCCVGNPKVLSTKTIYEKRIACCKHKSRQVLGRYVLFVPPEAIIGEFISSGLAEQMFGLEEEDIVEGVMHADAMGSHHILYSENACAIYKEMNWNEAEKSVRKHINQMKKSDPVSTLNSMVNEAKEIKQKNGIT